MFNNKSPKISVVTVCLNASSFIQKTINSVIKQKYRDFEYIIIDGGSTDDTIDTIKKHEGKITFWKSEKDHGIYDAMNKSLEHCHGEWIIFMNAGDGFYSPETLEKIAPYLNSENDVVYGDSEVVYPEFKYLRKAGSPRDLWRGMVISHQSLFVRTNILRGKKFSLNETSADFRFVLSCLSDGCRFSQVDFPISSVSFGGVSDKNQLRVVAEWRRIAKEFYPKIKTEIYYDAQILFVWIKQLVKSVLPTSILNFARRRRTNKT